ncbi:response regulator transcription factor [Paenibacillus sp. N3/727]|uniref:response regulator transcription factor n=1 Tax=Paenibacillus sp. N3/727 TaxID=2925845 RepID=UPI001F53C2D1|nr:response regulator transcription factor [Paenibacillus sp. N3/727]UNK20705.1 response regulator transcription factor [Paenibacillus sp. N3/727]
MNKILIVEDDRALNQGIVLTFRQEDYEFTQCYTQSEARDYLSQMSFDLILLDVNLPDGSGLDLCMEIRQHLATPIIFLTANDLEVDVVTGFELGADDYITKPFSLMILRARVSAILRRSKQESSNKGLIIDHFEFNFDEMRFLKRKELVELSKTEQKLLKLLVQNQGIVLARSVLVDKIWTDGAEYVDENALSVTIKRLRNKLEDCPAKPKYIQTVYGVGYSWTVGKRG